MAKGKTNGKAGAALAKKPLVREAVKQLGPDASTQQVRDHVLRRHPELEDWVWSKGFSAGLSDARKEFRAAGGGVKVKSEVPAAKAAPTPRPAEVAAPPAAPALEAASSEPAASELVAVKASASAFGDVEQFGRCAEEVFALLERIGRDKLTAAIRFWKEND